MNKIYIVLCRMDGCEECSNFTSSIIAVSHDREWSNEVASQHNSLKHLHYADAAVVEMDMDAAIHFGGAKKEVVR